MIKKIQKEDIDQIYEIEEGSFVDSFTRDFLESLLKRCQKSSFCYLEDGKIVAFYIASFIIDQAEIYTIAVDIKHRNKKIASKLMKDLIERCKKEKIKEIFLEVSTNNTAALNLYKKYGFEIIGLRKNYYTKTKEDAYSMRKEIL